MATLMIDGLDEHIVSTYETVTEEEKEWVKKVIEDILSLWDQKRPPAFVMDDRLRERALEFAAQHPTFPLDWSRNKLTREELNER